MAIPGWDTLKNYWGAGSQSLSDEERRLEILRQAGLAGESGDSLEWGIKHPEALNLMMKGKAGIGLDQRQKLFQIAKEGGAAHGGPAISQYGESGIGYADQRDITKTFPGAMSKEEEEEQAALRAYVGPSPGLFKW